MAGDGGGSQNGFKDRDLVGLACNKYLEEDEIEVWPSFDSGKCVTCTRQ